MLMSFIVDDLVGVNNYALEKYANQTSMAYLNNNGPTRLAVDGDLKTCSRTGKIVNEFAPVTNEEKNVNECSCVGISLQSVILVPM